MTVVALWRYPVKSASGEVLSSAQLRRDGVVGDRRWAVAEEDGTLVSAKHPRLGGPLLQILARCDASSETTLVVPGRGCVVAGTPSADAAVSDWLGRPVYLTRDVKPGMRLSRRWPDLPELVPEWEPTAHAGEEAVTAVAAGGRIDSFVDYGAVHLVTTRELDALSATAGSPVDPRRFRPNVLIDGVDVLSPGMRVQIGDVVLRVNVPTPRCVVPKLAQREVPEDLSVLTAVARQERKQVATLGRAACVGVYATVEHSGCVHTGDGVQLGLA
ncbi:MAG TPA: MOSC domain-containing protein [Mycobacteriales bacterium]|jgi:uncharacterized protein YcbX|nr:MOSC domain-containing protein [Mycobacteriales bacterium]